MLYPAQTSTLGLFKQVKDFLPSNFPTTAEINATDQQSEERYAAAKKTNRNFFPEKTYATPGINFNISLQRRIKLANKKAGFVLYANYLNDYQAERYQLNIVSNFNPELGYNPVIDRGKGPRGIQRQLGTLMFNGGIELNAKNKISIRNILNYHTENTADLPNGEFQIDSVYWGKYVNPMQRFTEQKFYLGSIKGEHILKESASQNQKLDWHTNFVYSAFREPGIITNAFDYYPNISIETLPDKNSGIRDLYPHNANDVYLISIFYLGYNGVLKANNTERVFSGRLNYNLRLGKGSPKIGLDAGLFTNVRNKNFRSRTVSIFYPIDSNLLALHTLPPSIVSLSNYRNIFNNENIGTEGFTFLEFTEDGQNYDAIAQNHAGYAQVSWTPNATWRLYGGVRLDYFHQFVGYFPINGEPKRTLVDRQNTLLLPSFSAIYRLNEKTNIRFAFGQTVVRPLDRDLANYTPIF